MPRIFLNPGHWPHEGNGYDPGAVNRTGVLFDGKQMREADFVRHMAYKIKARLEHLGLSDVIVFGAPTLKGIVDRANTSGADLFVSLHLNAFNGVSRGVEIFTNRFDKRAEPLAHKIYNEIRWQQSAYKRAPFYWRGEKKAGFYVIKYTKMPAVLLEMGFVDNDAEAREMTTLTWQNRMANAVAHGIRLYLEERGEI